MNWAGPKLAPPAAPPRARPTRVLGVAIVASGAAILVSTLWQSLLLIDARIAHALLGGSVAALATACGAAPVLAGAAGSMRWREAALGFGAGVMLAASVFSLIVPALASAVAQGARPHDASLLVLAGVALGASMLWLLDRRVQASSRAHGAAGASSLALRRAWLFVAAITLHNFPEGLAIGVAFAGPDAAGAIALSTGISIQDIPEGLTVALALRSVGYDRVRSVALGALSGVCEPVAAVFGAGVVTVSAGLLPWGLAFAAGAMLYVIVFHMIPESWSSAHRRAVVLAFAVGFALMAVLDTSLR